jgi:quinol monooxygenase YgiN
MADEVVVYACFTAKEGSGAELADVLRDLVELVQREEGLLNYSLHRGIDDPDKVWFFEIYADQAAFDAHGKFPEFGETFARIRDLVAGPPEVIRSEVVDRFLRA